MPEITQAGWWCCQYSKLDCATIPHIEQHHLPVLIQCLLYYTQRNACLFLHTLHTVRDIFCIQERVYAFMYPHALLRKRPRGIGDEGLFKTKCCVVHCRRCARLDMSCGSLCVYERQSGVDADTVQDIKLMQVSVLTGGAEWRCMSNR